MKQLVSMTGALLLGGTLLFASSCGGKNRGIWPSDHNEKSAEIRIPRDEQAPGGESAPDQATAQPAAPAKIDEGTGGFPEESTGAAARPPVKAVPELPPVYFDFDKSELNESSKKALEQHVLYIKSAPEIQVVLRGHTDTAGTEEYNIALGSRRAQAVRDYLIQSGIAATKLETISFGEGLPLAEGSDETVHKQNRRVEFFLYERE